MQEFKLVTEDSPGEKREKILRFFNKGADEEMTKLFDTRKESFGKAGYAETRRIKIGRNDPCPCGSGKKFKKCCIRKVQEL